MPIQMELNRIIISEMRREQLLVLKEVDGERNFPIVIDDTQASAIERRIRGVPPQRPMTHDLLASIIESLGGTLERIEINDLRDHTFFAQLYIRQNGNLIAVDSRPSDAIALGIATMVPIFVAEHVLNAAG
jgi:bifunctional DNase/RNase